MAGLTLARVPGGQEHLDDLTDALRLLGFQLEGWPAAFEKPKFMFARRTGLRAKISFDLSRHEWLCELIWEK